MMMKSILYAFLIVVFMAPAAIRAADAPPTVFYAKMYQDDTGKFDFVKIDTASDLITNIASFEETQTLPNTLESFSSLEWLAFQQDLAALPAADQERIREEMSTPDLTSSLKRIWQTHSGDFLIERLISKCFTLDPASESLFDAECYGAIQFSLLPEGAQEERIVWSLPYHRQQGNAFENCYSEIPYETERVLVDQVLLHPSMDLFGVRLWAYRCSAVLFLIDYSAEAVEVSELTGGSSADWSPDGTQLAFLQNCDYNILDLATDEQTLVKSLTGQTCDKLWVGWPTHDTLIFAEMNYILLRQEVVWHTISTQAEEKLGIKVGALLVRAVTLQDDDSGVVLAMSDPERQIHPNVAFDETPGVFLAEDLPTPIESHSPNRAYAFVEGGVIDADLNVYPIDFESYREQYGADRMEPVIIGVVS